MRRTGRALGLLSAALAMAAPAAAEGTDLAELLNEPIVTTASQNAETASTAPATSTTISAEDLRRQGIRTLEEAVNYLSLGVSSGGGRSMRSTIDLGARGVLLTGDAGSHFLLLIDGHAVNEPFNGTARFDHTAGIPIEAVDRIEVIVGPGSVLYGSNAMLGVISVTTKSAATLKGITVAGETELPVWRRAAVLGGASFRLFGSKAEVTGAAQYWEEYGPDFVLGPVNVGTDGLSMGPAITERGGAATGIWGGRRAERSTFAYVPSGLLRFRVGDFELSMRGRIADWGRPFGGGDFDDPNSRGLERNASADLKYRRLLTPQLEVSARAYGDVHDLRDSYNASATETCPILGITTCQYSKTVASRWAGAELQANYSWLSDGSLATLVGADGRTRFAGSKSDSRDFDTNEPFIDSQGIIDKTDQIFGAYLQQTWTPSRRLGFNAGARLDHDPRFDPVISPRAASSFGLWEGGTLRGIYSEAFRAPSFEESDYGDFLLARARNLRPETVRSVEGSFEQRVHGHRLFFGVFKSWWKDLVALQALTHAEAIEAVERGELPVAVASTSHMRYENAASIESYGFNAAIEGSLVSQRFRYGLNLTESYSRRRDPGQGDQELPVAPQLFGNARVSYDLGGSFPTVALGSYVLSARPANVVHTPGFSPRPFAPVQVDLRATVTGPVPIVRGLSYRLSAAYLFGDRGPYALGRTLLPSPEEPSAHLIPLQSFRVSIGLEYRFLDD